MKPNRETSQKRLLQKEIIKRDSFFTAEEIYQEARKKDNRLGIATVYRFLKNLRKTSKIHSYVCNRRILYSKEEKSHCHFTCEKCGLTNHFSLEKIDFMKQKIEGDICHFQLDITGICKKCKK